MSHEVTTEVLVTGAGPIGLVTALCLAENGVRVRIIDQEECTATHSYACVLHPRSLSILNRLGIASDIIDLGYRVDRVAFYSGNTRHGEIDLSLLKDEFPFIVVLSQSGLEELLERRLVANGRVTVNWNHRLSALESEGDEVIASVDRFCHSAKGYSVPSMDWEVQTKLRFRAAFVVGADGVNSSVRQLSDIEFVRDTPAESFAVYETECGEDIDHEARIVLGEKTANVMWPVSSNHCRWTLQVPDAHMGGEHCKDRSHWLLVDGAHEAEALQALEDTVAERAPWFARKIKSIDWSTMVQFEHGLVRQYGRNRCWLAGDAAHQTSPIGMQSMNVGLWEAVQLADVLSQVIQEKGSPDLLKSYDADSRREWRRLFGLSQDLEAASGAGEWMARNSRRIMQCIPGSGTDFEKLFHQLVAAHAV